MVLPNSTSERGVSSPSDGEFGIVSPTSNVYPPDPRRSAVSDALQKVRTRLAWNWDEWNHPLRAMLLVPVFTLLGGLGSILLQTELVHRGYDALPGGLLGAVFSLGGLCLGLVVLALLG